MFAGVLPQPIMIVSTVPPGSIVSCLPPAEWLAVTVTVTLVSACNVPDDGLTPT